MGRVIFMIFARVMYPFVKHSFLSGLLLGASAMWVAWSVMG